MHRSPTCVDASLVVRRIVRPGNTAVQQLWERWESDDRLLYAPLLYRYEIVNTFHRYERSGQLDRRTSRMALEVAFSLPIQMHTNVGLHAEAWDFARRFNLPAAYDAHYLALAQRLGIELWTADQRLANTVGRALPWVRLVA